MAATCRTRALATLADVVSTPTGHHIHPYRLSHAIRLDNEKQRLHKIYRALETETTQTPNGRNVSNINLDG